MTAAVCEVCGNPAPFGVTEVDESSGTTRTRHFCSTHAPQWLVPTAADEVKLVGELVDRLDDASDWTPEQKAEHREELRKLAEDIAAGRRRLFGGAD